MTDPDPISLDPRYAPLEELFAGLDVRIKFWVCPDHQRDGRVEWHGSVARCLTCHRTNQDAPVDIHLTDREEDR